jgi:hypothetical protein
MCWNFTGGNTYCPAGTYTSSNLCITCPVGKYSIAGSNTTSCSPCAMGRFSTMIGSSFCLDCPFHFYGNATGVSSCIECPRGTYNNLTGQTNVSACKFQTCFGWNSHTSSGKVFFYETSSKLTSQRLFRSNYLCGQMWHGGNLFVTNSTIPLSYSADMYLGIYRLGTNFIGYLDPDLSSSNLFQSNGGTLGTITCLYRQSTGTISSNDCRQFMSFWCQLYEQECSLNATCPGGYYLETSAARPQCASCPKGSYQDALNSFFCKTCSPGFYQDSSGQSMCKHCPSGYVGASVGLSTCTSCTVGAYQKLVNATTCNSCEIGLYQDSSAGSFCKSCIPGFFQDSTGASSCNPCPSGRFANASGFSNCSLCPLGMYQNSSGQSNCTSCSKGKYSNSTSFTSCKNCSAGEYQSQLGSTGCSTCPFGSYQTLSGQSSCVKCPVGKFLNNSNPSFSTCYDCAAGFYQAALGQSRCLSCSAGFFSNSSGLSFCEECYPGLFQSSIASTSCIPCAIGTFQNVSGQARCVFCSRGSYSNSTGLFACIQCKDSNTLSEGSTDISSCACDEGFYGRLPNNQCTRCVPQSGLQCPFNSTIPLIEPEHYRKGVTGADVAISLKCTPNEACEKTGFNLTTVCRKEYQGFLCGQCAQGYYRSGSSCRECPGNGVKWLTISAAMIVVVVILMRVTSRKTELPVDFRITLQAIQLIALFPNITQKWPSYVRVVLQIYSLAVSQKLQLN